MTLLVFSATVRFSCLFTRKPGLGYSRGANYYTTTGASGWTTALTKKSKLFNGRPPTVNRMHRGVVGALVLWPLAGGLQPDSLLRCALELSLLFGARLGGRKPAVATRTCTTRLLRRPRTGTSEPHTQRLRRTLRHRPSINVPRRADAASLPWHYTIYPHFHTLPSHTWKTTGTKI